ncbi:hypothetical protein [Pseudomonas savastanoi]|uniref:hypothetical protein n=1 Tax=Pseudomonas savastanoi TaxID=29438 RepID=UPI000F3F70A5|nr:hypothetical protein [Pseudomonas savastanoi]RMN11726.1 hypothetical protein ALQ66_04062 [Pseudomonas savastanoi pv. glycinea]
MLKMKTIIIPALFSLSLSSQAFAGLDENSKIDFDMQYGMGFYCDEGSSIVPYGQKWDDTFRGDIFFPVYYDRNQITDPVTQYVKSLYTGLYSEVDPRSITNQINNYDFAAEFGFKEGEEVRGSVMPTLKACYPYAVPPVTTPKDPVFWFNNKVMAACPAGQTVGGVSGGSVYRTGVIPFYSSYVEGVGTVNYVKSFSGIFSEIPMKNNGDGTSSFPQYGASDVDTFGTWDANSVQACATPTAAPTTPTNPTNPTSPADTGHVPVASVDYREFCPAGSTVGGVSGASTMRQGTVPIFTSFNSASNTTSWSVKQNATGAYDVFYTAQSAVGVIPYPTGTQALVDKYGSMNPGSEPACKAVATAPVLPTYSFDLPYNEYCKAGESVGGTFDGSNLRTGKVPVYFLFDSTTFTSKYFFYDGVAYTPIAMVEQNGFSNFPTITEDMVKKYGALDTNSIQSCQTIPVVLPDPIPPADGWVEDGYEYCAFGSTVGGVDGGLKTRHGTVSVWYGYGSHGVEQYFYKSAKNGDLTEFFYEDLTGYEEPEWNIGKSVIDGYGTWDDASQQACAPVRTFTNATETKTENCASPLTGTLTFSRTYKLWSDGVKDAYSDWSVTNNTCVVPPIIVDPTPPVTVPTAPADDFVTIKDFELTREMCAEGQTGEKTFRLDWTYDLYADGTMKNFTPKIKTALTNTCKDLTDDLIETVPVERNEACPEGQKGNIIVTGQNVTYSLSGTKYVEISRQNNCYAELSDYSPEYKTEDCPNGESGSIKSVRYFATKTDGTVVYPYGVTYSPTENTCSAPSEADNANQIANSSAHGILANQSVKASDSSQVKIITNFVNNAESDFGDYKLNISVDSLAVDSQKLGLLTKAWVSKTGGKINLGSLPRSAVTYIGMGGITKENAKNSIIRDVGFSQKTGKLTVHYTQSKSILDSGSVQSFDVPLIDAGQAGSALDSVNAY